MRPALWFLSFVLLLFLLPALAAPAPSGRVLPIGHEADRAQAGLYQPYVQDLMLRSEWMDDRRAEGLAL